MEDCSHSDIDKWSTTIDESTKCLNCDKILTSKEIIEAVTIMINLLEHELENAYEDQDGWY